MYAQIIARLILYASHYASSKISLTFCSIFFQMGFPPSLTYYTLMVSYTISTTLHPLMMPVPPTPWTVTPNNVPIHLSP